jgi:hypothetical protein
LLLAFLGERHVSTRAVSWACIHGVRVREEVEGWAGLWASVCARYFFCECTPSLFLYSYMLLFFFEFLGSAARPACATPL